MKIEEKDGGVLLIHPSDFDVRQIFDCGQAFRFREMEEGKYHGVAHGKYLEVQHVENGVFLWPCTGEEYRAIWEDYFDLNTDYAFIKKTISTKYEVLKKATDFGYGIRILKQDPWEIIISFIISANNNIPRIQGAIEKLSERFGEPFYDPYGQVRYAFPAPEKLAEADVEAVRGCGVGYRDKYIVKSAQMILGENVDIEAISHLNMTDAEKELIKLHGVGKKVADCILLFGFNHMSAFPVDTWVKKVISKYFLGDEINLKDILGFAEKEFGTYAGYVQQYLFFYIREGIG